MAAESFVAVAPDSTGKKIRNLAIDVLQPDGTTTTVQMQVTNICDENGRPYSPENAFPVDDNQTHELLAELVALLHTLILKLE